MFQWLRLRSPCRGVRSLVRELDPTSCNEDRTLCALQPNLKKRIQNGKIYSTGSQQSDTFPPEDMSQCLRTF